MSLVCNLLRPLLLALALVFTSQWAWAAASDGEPILVGDIESGSVEIIGRLGKKLGEIMVIDCAIVEKTSDLRSEWKHFQLKVLSVNGVMREHAIGMDFMVESRVGITVASDSYLLEKLLDNMRSPGGMLKYDVEKNAVYSAGAVPENEVDEYKKAYEGSQHKFVVYESGECRGVPRGVPDDAFPDDLSDAEFKFHTFLVVLAER